MPSSPALIPEPLRCETRDGAITFPDSPAAVVHPAFAAVAATFFRDAGIRPDGAADARPDLVMLPDADVTGDEGYVLEIDDDGVAIRAAAPAGAHWACRTLHQLLLDGPTLPRLRIEDRPRFRWRGLLLDCARHVMDVPLIERTIDLLALHRMNVLHWHLIDDQGWRLEVKSHPRLTEIGAWRDDGAGGRYGGFYTRDQVRGVVAYAAERGVTVVPEIELPGHCRAALAAHPEMSCTGETLPVPTEWGIFDDVFCAGNEAVFELLFDVLEEVLELFPSPYVHIGGDEVPKTRWRACPRCRARIEAEGLRDEDHLQSWFVERVGRWLAERGRRLIGWDEILEGGLPADAAVQSWRGFDGAAAAVRAGHEAVVSPTDHCYLDYALDVIDLRRAYEFEPRPEGLDDAEAALILGGEGNMWSERAPADVVETKIWPRLAALAERLWSPADRRDYEDFRARWRRHRHRLTALGADFGPEEGGA